MEDGERLSQPHSREYGWLGSDPLEIHKYGYILIFLASFDSSDPVWYVSGSKVGITSSAFLRGGYYNLYMFRRSVPACDVFFFLYSREKNNEVTIFYNISGVGEN